jgi:hypothetical protein
MSLGQERLSSVQLLFAGQFANKEKNIHLQQQKHLYLRIVKMDRKL